jgi:hypothetical protein
MSKNKQKNIPDFESNEEYLSSEVQELLGQPPHWLATWGTAAIVCSVALLIVVSIVFSYPDTIKGEFLLKTSEPSAPVQSGSSGFISELRVTEGSIVTKNEILVVFESNASADDVLRLDKEVDKLSEFNLETLKMFQPDWNLKLGELEPYYISFVNTLEYPFAPNYSADVGAMNGTEDFINNIQSGLKQLLRKKEEKTKELVLAEAKLNNTLEDYRNSGDQEVGKKLYPHNKQITELNSEIKSLNAQIEKHKNEVLNNRAKLLELQVKQESGTKERIFQLKEKLASLKSEINKWKEQYLVLSPESGKVQFFTEIAVKEFKKAGEELMVILPVSSEKKLIGQVKLPALGSGKVSIGQPVTIKIDRYPFREFGVLSGEVSKTYDVPSGNVYNLDISLKKGLKTDKGKELDFQYGLTGSAEIITENKSFFSRLFEKII